MLETTGNTLNPVAETPPRAPSPIPIPLNADEDDELSLEARAEMFGQYEESLRSIGEGEIVRGTVLAIDDKEVLVDVGFKSEGVIALAEFSDPGSIKVGDVLDVFLEKMENQDGLVVLSKQRADFVRVWDRVKEAHDSGQVVEGKLVHKIKGGVVVDLYGVEAFLPGSQIALRQVQNVDALLGQAVQVRIIKLNKRRRNIVVSRRAVLEDERNRMKASILQDLAKDQIREGVVKNITDFGAFVDLGGIDGLLHITDMSWGRVAHPSELVKIGDKVRVKVLNFDPEKERISLGLKQLEAYPWEGVEDKYKVGDRVKGRVVSITDYGAFVELEKGIEGLVHVSEMSWTKRVTHPRDVLAEGQEVDVQVLDVDPQNRRISLGLKQTEPNPWDLVRVNHPVGSRVHGKVTSVADFGVFVEIEDGIEGLIHISQLSTERVDKPQSLYKPGDELEAEVISIDPKERRIALSIKALRRSEERAEVESYLRRERENARFSFQDILSEELPLDRDENAETKKP